MPPRQPPEMACAIGSPVPALSWPLASAPLLQTSNHANYASTQSASGNLRAQGEHRHHINRLPCPALPGGGVPASWAGLSGTFSYRCLSAGTHLWSRCACSGTSKGTNIPFDLAICFCLCNASWRTFSSARKGRSLSKHCIALYSRGLRPPGSRLPPVQGLLGTRWHSRR